MTDIAADRLRERLLKARVELENQTRYQVSPVSDILPILVEFGSILDILLSEAINEPVGTRLEG